MKIWVILFFDFDYYPLLDAWILNWVFVTFEFSGHEIVTAGSYLALENAGEIVL